jgi:hypothetical protein
MGSNIFVAPFMHQPESINFREDGWTVPSDKYSRLKMVHDVGPDVSIYVDGEVVYERLPLTQTETHAPYDQFNPSPAGTVSNPARGYGSWTFTMTSPIAGRYAIKDVNGNTVLDPYNVASGTCYKGYYLEALTGFGHTIDWTITYENPDWKDWELWVPPGSVITVSSNRQFSIVEEVYPVLA